MVCDVLYIIGKLLERRYLKWALISHLDIWNTSYGQKKGRESNCQFDSRLENVRNRPDLLSCWTTCDIPLESSRRGLQLCLRLHLDPRSAHKVMGLQSRGSLRWRDFGTPTRESQEKKTIWMWAPWRGADYTIRGRWWLPPSPSRGESCVFVLPMVRLSTKGVPTMH
jgi:hypothetical protein